MSWTVYLLKCADGTLYCGCTNNLTKRLAAHNRGQGAKYTRSRRPVALAWQEEQPCDGKFCQARIFYVILETGDGAVPA